MIYLFFSLIIIFVNTFWRLNFEGKPTILLFLCLEWIPNGKNIVK